MNKLMASGALIRIGRRGGGRADEQVARRHLDEVARTVEGARAVERPAAAFAEFRAGRCDEGVHMRQPRGQIGTRRRRFALIILDLIDVEDPGGPGVEALGAVFVGFVRVGASVFRGPLPVLNNERPPFALADLAAELLVLLEGRPESAARSAFRRRRSKAKGCCCRDRAYR